jgi:hypothetical protein
MDDACLHDGLLPHGIHHVRQALEPVAHQHAHVPHPAVLDLGQHPQPVLGALPVAVLPGPQAQDVPLAVSSLRNLATVLIRLKNENAIKEITQ